MRVRVLPLIGVSLAVTKGDAQMPLNESYVKAIQNEDVKVKRLEMKWHLTSVSPAHADFDLEKSVAMAQEHLKQSNLSAKAKEEYLAHLKATGGKAIRNVINLTFLRDGASVRAEMLYETLNDGLQGHDYDAYDGINAIVVRGTGPETPKWGQLTRESRDVLRLSAHNPLERLFLFHGPIFESLPKQETKVIAEDSESVTLDCPAPTLAPMRLRVHVSKKFWRPTAAEMIMTRSGKPHWHFTTEGYHECQGVWIPSTVAMRMNTEQDYLVHTNNYILQSARMNEEATNAHLAPIVPTGTNMDDFRFGPNSPVSYRVTDFIPSDEEVRFMLDKDREAQAAMERDAKRRTLLTGVSIALASCFGVLAWRKRRSASRARKGDIVIANE